MLCRHNYRSPLYIHRMPNKAEDRKAIDADRYIRCCLSKVCKDLAGKYYVHDGAKCHQSKKTIAYLQRHGVRIVAPWPASSPDMNMVEQLWPLIDKRIAALSPTTETELIDAIQAAYRAVPQEHINNIALGFYKRLCAVESSGGLGARRRVR